MLDQRRRSKSELLSCFVRIDSQLRSTYIEFRVLALGWSYLSEPGRSPEEEFRPAQRVHAQGVSRADFSLSCARASARRLAAVSVFGAMVSGVVGLAVVRGPDHAGQRRCLTRRKTLG